MRLHLGSVFDNVVDLVDLFCTDGRESFFDFDDIRCTDVLFQSLSI